MFVITKSILLFPHKALHAYFISQIHLTDFVMWQRVSACTLIFMTIFFFNIPYALQQVVKVDLGITINYT